MSFNSSINELEDLKDQFHTWKKYNPQRHIPKQLWNHALDLIPKYGLDDIAKSIGYPSTYIRLKQQKRATVTPPEIKFVEIQPSQPVVEIDQVIRINIQDHQGTVVELSFKGNVDQTFPLILSLFKEEKCSK